MHDCITPGSASTTIQRLTACYYGNLRAEIHLFSGSASCTRWEPEHDTVHAVTDASGRRAIVDSVDEPDRELRSTLKWINLVSLTSQLF